MSHPSELSKISDPSKDVMPYQLAQPWGMQPEMVIADALEGDSRLWVPLSEGTWSRPLHLNVTTGYYVHLLRVTRSGLLQRHRHSGGVHAYVIKGSWFYLEHNWVARAGTYVFEPPGETHTLMVPEDCEEMITMFTVQGPLIFVDPYGVATGYEDVFTRIDKYRAHFDAIGLGADHVKNFIR